MTEEDTDQSFNIGIDPVVIDMSRIKLNESSSQVELYHDSSSSSANEFKGITKQAKTDMQWKRQLSSRQIVQDPSVTALLRKNARLQESKRTLKEAIEKKQKRKTEKIKNESKK